MSAQMTELPFLEHLAPRFSIRVPEYLTGDAGGARIQAALEKWGGKGLVKPDVLSGRRGKAGTVVPVTDSVEAQKALKRALSQPVNDHYPRSAYLVQFIPGDIEIYTAVTYSSYYLGPVMTVSLEGGVDIEQIEEGKKVTFPIDVYRGFNAYQASEILSQLKCPQKIVSALSQALVNVWDLFISTGMRMCEINPWRVTPDGRVYACDFKAVFDEANFKFKNIGFELPEYPANVTLFEQEMAARSAASHQGQAHVADLGGRTILPILFGGGASTIITETLMQNGGDPIFLSDFGGNPPYERMLGTARMCFEHHLAKATLVLILGGKANNTIISVTFKAIADALQAYVDEHGPISTPVIIGRGGPQLVRGLLTMKDTLESLGLPHAIFGPDTPVTLVAEYAARIAAAIRERGES